jgi:hypothetical protein
MSHEIEQIAPVMPRTADTGIEASMTMAQQAMTLFQCKDGSLVRDPKACTTPIGDLPKLTITG